MSHKQRPQPFDPTNSGRPQNEHSFVQQASETKNNPGVNKCKASENKPNPNTDPNSDPNSDPNPNPNPIPNLNPNPNPQP
jgi:hypothetical protein